MKKEQFLKLEIKQIHCDSCDRELPKSNFCYSWVRMNGTSSRCKSCDWFFRNREVKIDGWTNDEIHVLVDFIIFEESGILNDLLKLLTNKTIEDLINAFHIAKIGNKRVSIKATCNYCKEDVYKPPSVYLKNDNLYCSDECYWKDKPNIMKSGKNSPYYNRIKTHCTNCKKDIEVIPFDYNNKNSFGDSHNFCSQECYWEYRSEYYVGDKSSAINRIITDEMREKMKVQFIKNSRSADKLDSKIQLTINDVLDELQVVYEREHIIEYYAIDNYLVDTKLIIEVMGDYWHVSPLKYNENKYLISERQASWIHRDKIKHSYIKNHNNVEILYLWEYDINNNIKVCKELIQTYIDRNGELDNYHSFNYKLSKSGDLKLKDNLIKAYQDISVEDYRHLIDYKNKK